MTMIADKNKLFITDGGIGTTILYQTDFPLRQFAAFEMLLIPDRRRQLEGLYKEYVFVGEKHRVSMILDTPTWRASPDYLDRLGHKESEALRRINTMAVQGHRRLREEALSHSLDRESWEMFIAGQIGPRGDGYKVNVIMDEEMAERYHTPQATILAEAGVDLLSGMTMTNVPEAIGVARAAKKLGIPCCISFTLDTNHTDARLPDGTPLGRAIECVDLGTQGSPLYYLVNCVPPSHVEAAFAQATKANEAWLQRVQGIKANPSKKTHEELDKVVRLDEGNCKEFGVSLASFRQKFGFNVLGGCCGSTPRHIEQIIQACKQLDSDF